MTNENPSLRVLYVEDNPADADLARRELTRLAPETRLEVATTMGAALELLADPGPPFDVVLTDLRLPDGSGLEILSHIRERELPMAVVIITGSGDQEAVVAALKAGADDYQVKRAAYLDTMPRVLAEAYSGCQARLKRRARPLSVLYAEPNSFDVDLARRHLAQHAPYIHLEVAGSGEEVLNRLAESASHLPDVLLLDFQLPGLNALEVVKSLRQERGIELPVVLVTGHGTEDVAIQALRLGVDEYLVKNDSYLPQLPVVLERLQKQAKLNRSEERYRGLFENNHAVMLVVNPENGRIVDANPAAASWYGWTREELCNKNISEINTLPLAEVKKQIEAAYSRKDWRFLFSHRLADETVRDVEVFSGPVEMGDRQLLYSIVQDITARKQAEEELKRSEEEFRNLSQEFNALLDAIPDSIMLLDPELEVLWANRAAIKNIAASPGEESKHCYRIWHNRTMPCRPCPVLNCFETGKPVEETIAAQDGKVWDIRTVPLKNEDGKTTKVIELKRDITEHKNMEKQYLHAQKMESIGTLAGGVAHDFNNILQVITGYSHLAHMAMTKDDVNRQHIASILEAAERATQLTGKMLLFSRREEGERRPLELTDAIGRMIKFLQRIIGEDIILTQTFVEVPLPILADVNQLEQVLMNLAANARDAMPNGGELIMRVERIALDEKFVTTHGFGKPGVYALLTVSDTGTGMDPGTLGRIFEPFFTTKEPGKGTGLGLSVVYGIINQHDGFINAYSEPGKGTTFRIYLPCTELQSVESGFVEDNSVTGGTETILLAEDDSRVMELMEQILSAAGYTVIKAVDGKDAIRVFRENADRIQLLLFDLIMPKMNGKEAAEEINNLNPELKTIFLSGYAADLIRTKLSLDNESYLIVKPVAPGELLKKVRDVLDGRI